MKKALLRSGRDGYDLKATWVPGEVPDVAVREVQLLGNGRRLLLLTGSGKGSALAVLSKILPWCRQF